MPRKTHFQPPEDVVWDTESKRPKSSSLLDVAPEYVNKIAVEETSNPSLNADSTGAVLPAPSAEDAKDKKGKNRRGSRASTLKQRRASRVSTMSQVSSRNTYRRYSGGGDNPSIIMDWYMASGWNHMAGFDLELWWGRISGQHRIGVGVAGLVLAICLMHLAFGIYLITVALTKHHYNVKNPYLCETDKCRSASLYMSSTMNFSVDPCDNFYEFVCGNYPNETGKRRGNQFSEVIRVPAFPVEFGESSILASILKDYRNDPKHDQSVKYYQACLNLENRKKFGLEAFLEVVEYVFGTRDFTKFEGMTVSMEEIGSRMFHVLGHASYVNMAFYTYPYIQILRPSSLANRIYFVKKTKGGTSWENDEFATRALDGLLRELKVPKNSELEEDILTGIDLMGLIVDDFYDDLKYMFIDKDLDTVLNDPEFRRIVESRQARRCPPFGIQLDMDKILQLFIEDSFRVDFFDLMALKFHAGFKLCFERHVSSFTIVKLTNPKTAFVGLWLLDLFWDYHLSMDSAEMMKAWNLTDPIFNLNDIVNERKNEVVDVHEEFLCLVSLYRNLGYMPSIRYLLSITDNPAELIGQIEDEITAVFEKVSDIFQRIPKTEVDVITAHLGQINFARGIYVDVGVPLVNGILDETMIDDLLNFTADHLRNSIVATRYTIENARKNWLGSVDSEPIIQWWGSGGPSDIRSELLDLREPMPQPARYVEKLLAGDGNGSWETFLGRKSSNYVLYPLSLIGEPHVTETMALYYAGYRQKIIRSLLALPEHQFKKNRYTTTRRFYTTDDPTNENGGNRTCKFMYNGEPRTVAALAYTYTMLPYTLYDFSYLSESNFNTIMALREALRQFREERKALLEKPFNWTVPKKEREMRMQRQLPGKMEKYSEEQLYFITWVRHACRGGWKNHKEDALKGQRWLLETEILYDLMQMEEFGRVWGCGKNAFMNNLGLPRCLRWSVDE